MHILWWNVAAPTASAASIDLPESFTLMMLTFSDTNKSQSSWFDDKGGHVKSRGFSVCGVCIDTAVMSVWEKLLVEKCIHFYDSFSP